MAWQAFGLVAGRLGPWSRLSPVTDIIGSALRKQERIRGLRSFEHQRAALKARDVVWVGRLGARIPGGWGGCQGAANAAGNCPDRSCGKIGRSCARTAGRRSLWTGKRPTAIFRRAKRAGGLSRFPSTIAQELLAGVPEDFPALAEEAGRGSTSGHGGGWNLRGASQFSARSSLPAMMEEGIAGGDGARQLIPGRFGRTRPRSSRPGSGRTSTCSATPWGSSLRSRSWKVNRRLVCRPRGP